MKKPIKYEYEGPVEIKPGVWASDTGDIWHYYMPREFWTPEARRLFDAAEEFGIIVWPKDPRGEYAAEHYEKGENMTKAQLAYWCKRASTWLGLDRGSTTNWRPFEKAFGDPAWTDPLTGEKHKGSNPLKAALHDIDYTTQAQDAARTEYTQPIDIFFEILDNNKNTQQ